MRRLNTNAKIAEQKTLPEPSFAAAVEASYRFDARSTGIGDGCSDKKYTVSEYKHLGGERMALFEQLKKWVSSGQRRTVEKDIASLHGTVGNSDPPSFAGTPGIAEEEKRERVLGLTPREYELYLLLLEGFTLRESAKQLSVKYSTANTHMTGIYKKLGVKSRAELIINYRSVDGKGTKAP